MEVLLTHGFGDSFGAASSEVGGHSAYSVQLRQLLAQRERLLAEVWSEERHEAAELAKGKACIAASQAEERQHREAALDAKSRLKLAEERLSSAETGSGNISWNLWMASEGLGASRAMLHEEANLYREKLASARSAWSSKVAAKAATERQRLDECIGAIRTMSQENQALEANQQMAQAHLKALEGMAVSSAAQVHIREGALHSMLRQLEDQESISAEVHVRQEVVQAQLDAATEEIRRHEAISGVFSAETLHLKDYQEFSEECKSLKDEVERMKRDSAIAQEKLDSSQRLDYCVDHGLHANVEELRLACEAAARALHDLSFRKPLLESEIARLTTEFLSEKCVVADLEEIRSSILTDSHTFRTGVDVRVAALNTQLATEKVDAAAVASLENEEQVLQSELSEREIDCQRLQVEVVERDKHFATIRKTLQEQIAALRTEEMEEEQAVQRMSKERPRASNYLPSSGLAHLPSASPLASSFRAVTAHGVSAPPTRLQDPGCGAEPPPRRGLRRELSADSTRHIEDSIGDFASRHTTLTNSQSQPLLAYGQGHRPPSPFETRQYSEASTHITSAHHPHWREIERGWHPSTSVPYRAANAIPREGLEAMAFGGAPSANASWNAGNSDSSRLFHTHTASSSFESNLFHTPPIGQAQRASPNASTMRRSASTRSHMFADAFDHQAVPIAEADGLRGSTALRRARTPPARPSSEAPYAMSGNDPLLRGGQASSGRSSSMFQQDLPHSSDDRRTALQARLSELKGVIGASLQSLDEEEAADANAWAGARNSALAARDYAFQDRFTAEFGRGRGC